MYRADALRELGLFDERLGYGYDNDMSYRLQDAGFVSCSVREATSITTGGTRSRAISSQQYGFGYGRLELVAKHPRRFAGDRCRARR